ncbi:MAG: hypothetical protein ABIH37_04200 [archaeon]
MAENYQKLQRVGQEHVDVLVRMMHETRGKTKQGVTLKGKSWLEVDDDGNKVIGQAYDREGKYRYGFTVTRIGTPEDN